jgi:surface polysaccharide O-acyltransferase-like enzyme
VDGNLFVIPIVLGYFIMGAYLVKLQIRRRTLAVLTVLGLTLTVIATYFVTYWGGTRDPLFFQDPTSPTIILASTALFMLLNSYAKPKNEVETEKSSWKQRILHIISENSLSIYLFHIIALALIRGGVLGYAVNGSTIDAIIGVPITVALVLGLSLLIIVPLKKIPGLKKLIG